MKKRLLVITIWMLLFTGCASIPGTTTNVYYSAAPLSTGNENRTPESSNSDQPSTVSTPQPQTQTQNPLSSDNGLLPSKEFLGTEPTVIYKGPVEHIFFHPLVVYPELAFDGDSLAQGYNDWFLTVPEFKQIIEQLYKNDYILIDIHSLYEENTGNGHVAIHPKELKLPKGKKPLVLSIDDLNYYDYMIQNGNVHKLILNPSGEVFTESVDLHGKKVVSDDNEIVPILDHFVREHPDFSDHGAKGLIALTGYQGILGYRTNDKQAAKAVMEQEKAAYIIRRLKETGWSFASHGWGHLDAIKVSYDRFVQDTKRWKREVDPLIGPTSIYVYPFGSRVETDGDKFKALNNAGFHVLCSVGPTPYLKWQSGVMMMDRRHIDGIALKTQRTKLLELFDANDVIDPIRLKLMKMLKNKN
jgi:hypothetical protein